MLLILFREGDGLQTTVELEGRTVLECLPEVDEISIPIRLLCYTHWQFVKEVE